MKKAFHLRVLRLLSLVSFMSLSIFQNVGGKSQGSCKNIGVTPNPNPEKGKFVAGNEVDFFNESFLSFKSFWSLDQLNCIQELTSFKTKYDIFYQNYVF